MARESTKDARVPECSDVECELVVTRGSSKEKVLTSNRCHHSVCGKVTCPVCAALHAVFTDQPSYSQRHEWPWPPSHSRDIPLWTTHPTQARACCLLCS